MIEIQRGHTPRGPVAIGAVARELGLPVSRVRYLADTGVLPSTVTTGGHRRFDLDAVRVAWAEQGAPEAAREGRGDDSRRVGPDAVVHDETWRLADADEDTVWQRVRQALESRVGLEDRTRRILAYATTEMVNNAIDHSGGDSVRVRVTMLAGEVQVAVKDDGRGVFAHLREARRLTSDTEALAELTKGKITTAPAGHAGEGIFFTSKAVDVFRLASNGLRWTVDNERADMAVGSSEVRAGTEVRFDVALDTDRDIGDVFRRFTDDTAFDRTSPVVRLFGLGVEFVSRSEAKRLASGLEKFSEVELDFTGVESVGQGFVDQLFRVWARDHPETALRPTHMNEGVEFMVRRGLPRAAGSPPD